ncbi:UPF0696 protein C11orf68 homolog isoform X2 [Acanthaster planci]|uniref:UPF0696 protein C11orf68 homolog isoform X2 n=1 Tax=Acanthaster planci TaxID=133434 RepID=A0A8B7XTL5_ACAPL|nr:UPF0696 protein C11orf68 homolog isoform X2 [Acanthaster planci]
MIVSQKNLIFPCFTQVYYKLNKGNYKQDDRMGQPWIIFDPSTENLDTFLTEKAPSKISSLDGHNWICVRHSKMNTQAADQAADLPDSNSDDDQNEELVSDEQEDGEASCLDMYTAWEELCATMRPTHEAICQFAKAQRCLVGKWLLFAETGNAVDELWSKVARAVLEGKLGISAKVSVRNDRHRSHVICIYNSDFTDVEAVRRLEKGIRSLGFCKNMTYKADLFTYLGVYAKNHYGVKPTIYSSKLDAIKRELVFQYDQRDAMEDKSQRKMTDFFKENSSSSPGKRKHQSPSASQSQEDEPTSKLPKRIESINDPSSTALDPGAPSLPVLHPL